MATFKVMTSVIRMRRHGGTFLKDSENEITSAEQFKMLSEIAPSGAVKLSVTDEERAAFEAELDSAPSPKAKAAKPAKVSAAKAARAAKAPEAEEKTPSDDAEGEGSEGSDEDSEDSQSDL